MDLFARVDPKAALETERGQVLASVVREQVGGDRKTSKAS
jgi:hypothetical protein